MRLTQGNIRMDTPAAVDKGVAIFAVLEARAQECVDEAAGFDEVFNAIQANGVISAFEAKAWRLRIKQICADFKADLHFAHMQVTQRAQFKNIDVPQTESGGGNR